MARMGDFDTKGLKELQKNLNKLKDSNLDAFIEECAKELAARLLRKVIKNTSSITGTLRRGWTGGSKSSAANYVDSLTIHHFGDACVIEIENPVEYASYYEYGHRTADYKGWVRGKFTLTIAEQDIQQLAPALLEKKLQKLLEGCFK